MRGEGVGMSEGLRTVSGWNGLWHIGGPKCQCGQTHPDSQLSQLATGR